MNNPRNYSEKAIYDTLRIKDGTRKVSFRYDLLDRFDVKLDALDGVTHAATSYGEFRPIKRSFTCKLNEHAQKEIDFLSEQIQPWFVLHMSDKKNDVVEWPLGIFMADSPHRKTTRAVKTRDIGMSDKTLVLEGDKFLQRFFIEKGTNYKEAIMRILNNAGITKINIADTDHVLLSDREFPIGTKMSLACNELLREINFTTIRIDEYGYARSERYIEPSRRQVTQVYDTNTDSVVMPEFTEEQDIADRPNVFVRVAINLTGEKELKSIAINNDPGSPISTVSRGRQIVDFRTLQEIADQETLDAFTRRAAIESTSAYEHLTFGTALMPTHGDAETLLCIFPDVLDGALTFHETSWEMPHAHDGVMTHAARRVVQI